MIPSRINFIGWYGMNNIGDDSFEVVFREAFSGHELIFTQVPDKTADAFLLGGGGVVDFGYFDGLAQVKEKPIYAVGVDIPLSGDRYRLVTDTPFRKILVRSKEYFWLGREQGIKNIAYMPDLAFWFESPERKTSNKPKLGVSLTQHLLSSETHVQDHLGRVLSRKKDLWDIVFLVFKPEDRAIIETVARKHSIPCRIESPKTPQEMLVEISQLNALLTIRFHGAIFANVCKVPFISLSTPGKHSLFCEQEDLHDSFIDFRDVNEYKLLTALNKMMSSIERGNPHRNREIVRTELGLIRAEIESLSFGGT